MVSKRLFSVVLGLSAIVFAAYGALGVRHIESIDPVVAKDHLAKDHLDKNHLDKNHLEKNHLEKSGKDGALGGGLLF